MKTLIAVSLILTLLMGPVAAHAFYYEGKCIVPQGKLKKCYLDFSKQESLKISYKDLEYQNLNREIQGKKIQHIAMAEKAQRRWAVVGGGIYALGPLGALFLLWKKKSTIFSLEYGTGKNTESILIGVNKKLGFTVFNQLEELSGKKVDGEMGKR